MAALETNNEEFRVVRRAFQAIFPLLKQKCTEKPPWLEGVEKLLLLFGEMLENPDFTDLANPEREALDLLVPVLREKLRSVRDDDVKGEYQPFLKFKYAFLAWLS